MGTNEIKLRLPRRLYRLVEKTARLAKCDAEDVVVSALEAALPPLPNTLPPALATDLARLVMLDREALQAIASAYLSPAKQRRFTTLLRKEQEGRLTARDQVEWESLKEEYLRVSQNKAKAQFVLDQRLKKRSQRREGE